MKNNDFLRIFGTVKPSFEEFQVWILKNNPETLQAWNPPLTSEEKLALDDSQFDRDPPFDIYSIEEVASAIIYVREETKKIEEIVKEINESDILNLLEKIKERKKEFIKRFQDIESDSIVKKHEIYLGKTICDIIERFLEELKKSKMFENLDLSEWTIETYAPITHLKTGIRIWQGQGKQKLLEKDYKSFKKAIIKAKIKDIKNNPCNWEFVKKTNMYWETRSFIKRKDGLEELDKELFTPQEFTEIEQQLRGEKNTSVGLIIFLILATISFLTFFWWLHRKKSRKVQIRRVLRFKF